VVIDPERPRNGLAKAGADTPNRNRSVSRSLNGSKTTWVVTDGEHLDAVAIAGTDLAKDGPERLIEKFHRACSFLNDALAALCWQTWRDRAGQGQWVENICAATRLTPAKIPAGYFLRKPQTNVNFPVSARLRPCQGAGASVENITSGLKDLPIEGCLLSRTN